MLDRTTRHQMLKELPSTLGATLLLMLLPSLLVWALHGSIGSLPAVWAMATAGGLSLLLGHVGARLWARRGGSDQRLFADLMLWAWIRRWLIERRVNDALVVLGLDRSLQGTPTEPNPEKRLKLLCKLASDLEARDPYVRGHSRRVSRYASLIASRMRLPRADVERIGAAAALHDIGKLHTPIGILHKPGPLTDEQFAVIKRHAAVGARIIQVLVEDVTLASIVRYHHERLDGSGYPGGLAGDDIPLGSRILAVADTFDAISANRPYRHARSHRAALEIIQAESGTKLDPDVVQAFQRVYGGERPLGAFGALVNGAGRLVWSLASSVSGVTLPAAGIAAATAALGGGLSGARHEHALQTIASRAVPAAVFTESRANQVSLQAAPRRVAGTNPSSGRARRRAPHAIAVSKPASSGTPAVTLSVAQAGSATNGSAGPTLATAVNVPGTGVGAGVSVSTGTGSSAPATSVSVRAGQAVNASVTAGLTNDPGQPVSIGVTGASGAALVPGHR